MAIIICYGCYYCNCNNNGRHGNNGRCAQQKNPQEQEQEQEQDNRIIKVTVKTLACLFVMQRVNERRSVTDMRNGKRRGQWCTTCKVKVRFYYRGKGGGNTTCVRSSLWRFNVCFTVAVRIDCGCRADVSSQGQRLAGPGAATALRRRARGGKKSPNQEASPWCLHSASARNRCGLNGGAILARVQQRIFLLFFLFFSLF